MRAAEVEEDEDEEEEAFAFFASLFAFSAPFPSPSPSLARVSTNSAGAFLSASLLPKRLSATAASEEDAATNAALPRSSAATARNSGGAFDFEVKSTASGRPFSLASARTFSRASRSGANAASDSGRPASVASTRCLGSSGCLSMTFPSLNGTPV